MNDAAKNWDRIVRDERITIVHTPVARDVAMLGHGIEKAAIVVDALLGTGVQGPLRDPIRAAVDLINSARAQRTNNFINTGVTAAFLVLVIIITMSIVLGAELGPKADPTTTTYTPRPEWYFFFLFELLKVIKPASLVPFATIGVPTVGMILLFLLPFYDRNPERRPERRPIATTTGIFVIIAMGYLTYLGASAGPPSKVEIDPPTNIVAQGPAAIEEFEKGGQVVAQSGCLACHKIGENGNDGPGPELTEIGGRLPMQAIERTLVNPTAPMPSFEALSKDSPEQFELMLGFLSELK